MKDLDRRAFLAGIPALAATGAALGAEEKLAMDGGAPIRATRPTTEFPGAQFYDNQERNELTEAYDSHSLFRFYGPSTPRKVESFEKELGAFLGAKYVLGVTSGTAALHTALTALGVGPGDEVILPAWTWHSSYTTILMTGALPVFAEVDESFTLDPADVERKITPQTKVIMPVHLFGTASDMGRIMPLAREHGIKVLEDAAQSFGAQYKGQRLGAIGDMGIYSFQLHKMITAGEGGALVTSDPMLYERAIRFHDLGLLRPFHRAILGEPKMPYFLGINYRMNEMTGAVMRGQLRKIETILARHRRNASYVRAGLQELRGFKMRRSNDLEGETGWTVDAMLPDKQKRDRFVKVMNAENVAMAPPSAATPLPPMPYIENKMAPHPAWPSFNSPRGKEIRYGAQCCPRTLEIYDRAATVTIGPKYTEKDLKDIVAAVTKVHRSVLA
ncbi:MAG TPA: DegT/DnrJ/EryC1/StrS family aminotransferase [Bryobacteraceae bacterium]|nr:DegT/DnrJ/EryC1/StrS family aminotransferase [Bryobacteraceae bacterium]